MAIDQRDVSSTLRFMDDRALQQYAAMHKNDPYIFPLAFQESQNRQRLRMGQQGAQGMQPEPKVADQALAQMAPQQLPEDVGIGALPAGNMQFAAEGGIMGYSDDNFAARSEPVVMMAEGGVARYQVGGSVAAKYQQESQEMVSGNRVQYSPDVAAYASQLANEERAARQAQEQAYLSQEQQRMLRGPYGAPAAPAAPAAPTALKGTMPEPGYTRGAMEGDPRLNTPPTQPVGAAPRADTGRTQTAAGPRREAGVETEKEPTGIEALSKKFTRDTELAQGALKNQRVGLGAELVKSAEEAKAEGEKRRKEEGDVFAGRESRLAAREKGIEGMGDKYMGLALLQAGAAMMSTPGNLGSVIGKGIAVGSERYIAGIDKINAAKDKFAEARDRLDDLRLNRADMTKKEIRDEDNAIRNARLKGQELLLDGATNDLKISNDNQKAIFGVAADALQTDKKIKSSEKIAGMQERGANARAMTPDKLVFDQLTKQYGGDTVKAAEALQKMKTEKFNVYDAYSKYLQAFAGKDTLKGPDDFDVFAKRFIPTVTPSKNTTVRTQPGG